MWRTLLRVLGSFWCEPIGSQAKADEVLIEPPWPPCHYRAALVLPFEITFVTYTLRGGGAIASDLEVIPRELRRKHQRQRRNCKANQQR